MKFIKRDRIILVLCALLFIYACDEKVPNKEMSLAKFEITRAESVYAKKYAPDEYKEAKNELMSSHKLVKEEKLEDSKKAAESSLEKAREAYEKSVPLLARDTIELSEKSLESADEAYAAVLAEEEFKQASDTLAKANELFELKNYYSSYETALEADSLAKQARNVALSKKSILQEAIDEVKATLDEAKNYNADKFSQEKYNSASENCQTAEKALEETLLKKGFAAMEIAKVEADEAYLTSIKGFTDEKIVTTKALYKQASESEGAGVAVDELEGAKASLDLAESLSAETKFKESMTAADESMRLSNIVINTKIPIVVALNEKDIKTEEDAKPQQEVKESEEEKDYFIYKVKYTPDRRDCLWRIAGKFYKKPYLWKKIYKANTEKIKNPHLIWPDMLLKVPNLNKRPKTKKENNMPSS